MELGQMTAQAKMREVERLQQTLPSVNSQKITEQLRKIDWDIAELTCLLFPNDQEMACELVKSEYHCAPQ